MARQDRLSAPGLLTGHGAFKVKKLSKNSTAAMALIYVTSILWFCDGQFLFRRPPYGIAIDRFCSADPLRIMGA